MIGIVLVWRYHDDDDKEARLSNGGDAPQDLSGSMSESHRPSTRQRRYPKSVGRTVTRNHRTSKNANTPKNQLYLVLIPDKKFYMPEGMKLKTRCEFDRWYAEQLTRQLACIALYDFEEELIAYCKSDVKLLKQACLTFKHDFELHAAFDPFEQMTIASACNWHLRMHCLSPEIIASEPLLG